jgi:hypothetical protein
MFLAEQQTHPNARVPLSTGYPRRSEPRPGLKDSETHRSIGTPVSSRDSPQTVDLHRLKGGIHWAAGGNS